MIRNMLRRALGAGLVVALLGAVWVAAGATLPTTDQAGVQAEITSVYLDYSGNDVFAKEDPFTVTAVFSPDSLRLTYRKDDPFARYIVSMEAPTGQELAVGSYATATGAGLSLPDTCYGSNHREGTFEVKQLETQPTGGLARFAATFEMHCHGGDTVYGSVFYHATVPQNAIVMPWSATMAAPNQAAAIEVYNPGNTDQSLRTEIVGVDAPDFTVGPGTTCGAVLAAGAQCTLSIKFQPVTSGSYVYNSPDHGGTRTAQLVVYDDTERGERSVYLEADHVEFALVALSVNRNPVRVGQSVTFTVNINREVESVQIWDGDLVIATAPVTNFQAQVSLTLGQGSHWIVASVTTPTTGRSESPPLKVIVQP